MKTYTVKVYRMNANLQENADLSGLTVNNGNDNVALTPDTFSAATTEYSAKVGNGIGQVTVTPSKVTCRGGG